MYRTLILTLSMIMALVCGAVATDFDWSKPETIDVNHADLLKTFDVNPEKLMFEGWTAYQDGQYEKATQYYLTYLQHVKNDSTNMYNLACCYGLLGKADMAAAWVEKSVQAGWKDMQHLNQDPDFAKVRDTEVFKTTVTKLEKEIADKKGDPGKMMMVPSESMIPMYVKLPDKYDAEKSYPLVVGLHGFGGKAENYAQIWENRDISIDFIYVALEAPYGFTLGKEMGYSWFLRMDEKEQSELRMAAGAKTVTNVLNGIKTIKKNYKVGNIYLTGFSQGAGLTFITGLKNPELFAGIAPFGGWLDTDVITEDDLKAAKKLPVLIVHGNKDASVEFKAAKHAEELLKKHEFQVEFFEFDGGHVVPAEGLKKFMKMIK